jgi:hypothetical protein
MVQEVCVSRGRTAGEFTVRVAQADACRVGDYLREERLLERHSPQEHWDRRRKVRRRGLKRTKRGARTQTAA